MKTLPLVVQRAAGIRDPFGSQLKEYRALTHIVNDTCVRRLKLHNIPVDYGEIAEVARRVNTPQARNYWALLRRALQEYTAHKIEQHHAPRPVRRGSLPDALAEMDGYALEKR